MSEKHNKNREYHKKRAEYEKRKEIAEHLLVTTYNPNKKWREQALLEGVCVYFKDSSWSPGACDKPVAPGSPLCKKHTEENNTLAIRDGVEESFIVIDAQEYKPTDPRPLNADAISGDRSAKENTRKHKRKRGWKLAWILTPSISFALGLLHGVNTSYSNHSYRRGITDEDIFSGFELGFSLAAFNTVILAIVYAVFKGVEKSRRDHERSEQKDDALVFEQVHKNRRGSEHSKEKDDALVMGEEATPSDITPVIEEETTPSNITIKCPVCNNSIIFPPWEKSGDVQCPYHSCNTSLHYSKETRTLRLRKNSGRSE
jgi:hypothetical protein